MQGLNIYPRMLFLPKLNQDWLIVEIKKDPDIFSSVPCCGQRRRKTNSSRITTAHHLMIYELTFPPNNYIFLSMFYFFWWFADQRLSFFYKKIEFNRQTNPTVECMQSWQCHDLIYIDGEIKSESTFKITSATQVITGFQEIRLSCIFAVCAWYRCQWHWCMRASIPLQIRCMYFMQDCFSFLTSITVSLPRLVSPRPAEASMSRPTGQMRDGDGPLGAGFNTTEGEEEDTPLLSSPKRNFRASYMFTAFLSTLLTITDWEVEDEGKGEEKAKGKTGRGG